MRSSVVLLALLAGACADFHRGPVGDAAPIDDPVFEQDVYPILLDKCQLCHSTGNQAQASRLLLTGNAKPDRAMVVSLMARMEEAAWVGLVRRIDVLLAMDS